MVTASGGQAELILDVSSELSLDIPALSEASRRRAGEVLGPISGDGNPLDAWGDGKFQVNLPHALSVLSEEPGLDSVVMYSDTNDGQPMAPTNYFSFLTDAAKAGDKSFYYMTTRHGLFRADLVESLRDGKVTILTGIRPGMLAIDRVGRWNGAAGAARAAPPSPAGEYPSELDETRSSGLSINEFDAKRILGAFGLPVVAEAESVSETTAELAARARAIGYPVVLKAVSDDIPHKTELDLVELAIKDDDALEQAASRLGARLGALPSPPADLRLVVQKMVTGGIEVFAGVSRDPDFGPMIAFGLGGTMIEVLDEFALRPLPLGRGDAEAMISETRAGRILAGVRGRPASDVAALAALLHRLSDFAWTAREAVEEIDLNPIMVLPAGRGCAIVDALIVRRPGTGRKQVETDE